MVDAADLKSASRKGVWVRVPPSAVAKVVSTGKQFPQVPTGRSHP
jgi:hypothetical protein